MATPSTISSLLDRGWLTRLACTLLTLPYWWSGLSKLFDLSAAIDEARLFGLEPAWLTVGMTVLIQLVASLPLIPGRWVWLAAGALAVFTALATLIAHPFWTLADPLARFHDRNTFLEHVGLIGGFLLAAILDERSQHSR